MNRLQWVTAILLSLGIEAQAEEARGQVFGAWLLRCATRPASTAPLCGLGQEIRSEDDPRINLAISFRKISASPNTILQLLAPLDTFLIEGAKIKIDQDEIGTLPFVKCAHIGCVAEGPMSDAMISKLRNGRNMLITIYINPGDGLRHIFPLAGFDDGYKALE